MARAGNRPECVFLQTLCAAPWQLGVNETGNGLLRQYFPIKISPTRGMGELLLETTERLNNWPRKCLETPTERF